MNAKADFARLVRAEVENGLSPQAAFSSVRRKHPEAFLAVLMSNGNMSRSAALAFVAERTGKK